MAFDGKQVCLSLAFNWHDSNCALSIGNKIVACLELERLFRSKHICASRARMELAVSYLLQRANLTINDVDTLVVNALNNPFENTRQKVDVMETSYEFLGKRLGALVIRHHLAHAGFYYLSPFSRALVSTCDGGGDLGERVAFFAGNGLDLKRLDCDVSEHTSALPYAQMAAFIYGARFSEGKMMALATLGRPSKEVMAKIDGLFPILNNLSVQQAKELLKKEFENYSDVSRDERIFGANLAFATQEAFVRRRLEDVSTIFRSGEYDGLVLGGGSALNLNCNTEIYRFITPNIFIPPCCDDTGIAIGQLAVAVALVTGERPQCNLPYLGIDEFPSEREAYLAARPTRSDVVTDAGVAAQRIHDGEICLAHIGRPEVGPRALGHRSFLVAPTKEMRKLISSDVKRREDYRPVAPIMLEDELAEYFCGGPPVSPNMLFAYDAKQSAAGVAPGVIHVDGTARVQTVNSSNSDVHNLLSEYRRISGCSILINTSLNLAGEPLSDSMFDTIRIAIGVPARAFIFLA